MKKDTLILKVKWFFEETFFRFFCLFGYHHDWCGHIHTRLITCTWDDNTTETYEDGYKCYHCLYCYKPFDKSVHDQEISTYLYEIEEAKRNIEKRRIIR